jgi:putative hemolysin
MSVFLIVLACIALNAGLAALEVALISASKAGVKAHGGPNDVRVQRFLRLRETPERALSAIQVGITLVSIVSGAVGGAGAQDSVAPVLQAWLDLSQGTARALAIAGVTVPLMMLTVLVGELVPKTLALRYPELIALAGARWLRLLEQMFLPVVGTLAWMTKTLGARIPRKRFETAAGAAAGGGVARHYAVDLFDLARRTAREAMVPWPQTITADVAVPAQSLADLALTSGHTRLPVVRDGAVVGLLHTKELLTFLAAGERDWRTLVRPALFVAPDDALLEILRMMQARRSHLAIVTAPGDAPLGIVTLEDILEEVLGDFYDEDDDRAVARLLAARGKVRAAVMPGRR